MASGHDVGAVRPSWIFATFLAWREQYRRAKGKDSRLILTTIIDEYNRVKPPGELDLDLAALFVRHCDDFTDERQLNAVCADLPGSYPGPFELIELKYGPKALAGKRLKLLRDARISQFRIWNDRDLDNYIEASWSVENKLPEPDETAAMKVAIRRARGSW